MTETDTRNSETPELSDSEAVERFAEAYAQVTAELSKVIVGQQQVVREMLIAMLSGGHCLIVGVPGLAKTLTVRTLAETLSLTFNRIQFTPDLMPADITGTEVLQEDRTTGGREFRFMQGPVFANVVLADEINRTPPKTQAALLEAMQERQVTAAGHRHLLPDPFFVLATQNPIEQEGTYPLPEAQLDRFMFEVKVDYPDEEEEFEIVRQTTAEKKPKVEHILTMTDLLELQSTVRKVPVADYVIRYAMQFARLTRPATNSSQSRPVAPGRTEPPDFVTNYIAWGAGPRASQYLILGAKAHALLEGRAYVSTDDVQAVAAPVLRHRIITNFNAEADRVTTDDLVRRLIEVIPKDPDDHTGGFGMPQIFKGAR